MELSVCEGGLAVRLVIDSEVYYFNWILPMWVSPVQDDPVTGALLPSSGSGFFALRQQRPTLVLDLDLTMVCCKRLNDGNGGGECTMWGVAQRPGLDEFLQAMVAIYEIVMFTDSRQSYADALLQLIDPRREFIKHRLYEAHLTYPEQLKDISRLGRELKKVVVVDDVPAVHGKHAASNVIQIAPFLADGAADDRLAKLAELLIALAQAEDVRIEIPRLRQQGALDEISRPDRQRQQ